MNTTGGTSREESAAYYRRQLEAVANNATLALFIMDHRQHCTYMNPAAERMTGFRLAEVQNRPLHDYVHHTHPDGTPYPLEECPIDQAFPQNMREQGEETFVHKDGHFYPVAFTASPILEGGRPVGTIIEVRDITEEKHAAAVLKESEERFRTLANTAPVLIWMAETDMFRNWFNEPWLEFTGSRMEQELGHGWAEHLHPADSERCFTTYTASSAARKSFSVEYRLRRHDGAYRWILEKGVPRYAADGVFLGYLGSCVDIQAQVEQREALGEANRAKSDFLAAMSHELRTPLNAISGYVDLLQTGIHGPLNDTQQKALARVQKNTLHLLTLIQDVLSFARLDAGRLEFSLAPLRVATVFHEVDSVIAPLAEAKGITLQVDGCDPDLRLHGDAERVWQILLNLTTNAIKFSPAGGRVGLSSAVEGDWVQVQVRDDGPGIAQEKQTAIFDPFVQLGRRLDRPQEGTGLGLSISRDLARGMGGDLTVESRLGEGSTFTLTLPKSGEP